MIGTSNARRPRRPRFSLTIGAVRRTPKQAASNRPRARALVDPFLIMYQLLQVSLSFSSDQDRTQAPLPGQPLLVVIEPLLPVSTGKHGGRDRNHRTVVEAITEADGCPTRRSRPRRTRPRPSSIPHHRAQLRPGGFGVGLERRSCGSLAATISLLYLGTSVGRLRIRWTSQRSPKRQPGTRDARGLDARRARRRSRATPGGLRGPSELRRNAVQNISSSESRHRRPGPHGFHGARLR